MATKEEIHILQQQVRENESKLDQAQLKAEQAASQAQALELQVQIVKQEAEAACELLAKQAALQTADQEYQSNAMIAKEAAAAAKEMNRRIGTCKQVVKRMLQQHLQFKILEIKKPRRNLKIKRNCLSKEKKKTLLRLKLMVEQDKK